MSSGKPLHSKASIKPQNGVHYLGNAVALQRVVMIKVVDHPLVHHELTILRNVDTSAFSFRESLNKISEYLLYEYLDKVDKTPIRVKTPFEETDGVMLKRMTFVAILRAGIPMLDVALRIVPNSVSGFVGIKRDENTLSPILYYVNLPPDMLNPVILDPMVATAGTVVKTIELIKEAGAKPAGIVSIVCSRKAVRILSLKFPEIDIVTAAIDENLNERGFIVPGLGDCGDRYYSNIKNPCLPAGRKNQNAKIREP